MVLFSCFKHYPMFIFDCQYLTMVLEMSEIKMHVVYMHVRNSKVSCMHGRNLKNVMYARQKLAETLLDSKLKRKNSITLLTCVFMCYHCYMFFLWVFLCQNFIKINKDIHACVCNSINRPVHACFWTFMLVTHVLC